MFASSRHVRKWLSYSLIHALNQQAELVLAEASLDDGSTSQIVFVHDAKVNSVDLEQLCVKVSAFAVLLHLLT